MKTTTIYCIRFTEQQFDKAPLLLAFLDAIKMPNVYDLDWADFMQRGGLTLWIEEEDQKEVD